MGVGVGWARGRRVGVELGVREYGLGAGAWGVWGSRLEASDLIRHLPISPCISLHLPYICALRRAISSAIESAMNRLGLPWLSLSWPSACRQG